MRYTSLMRRTKNEVHLIDEEDKNEEVPDAKNFVEKPLVGEGREEAGGPVHVALKHKQMTNIRLQFQNSFKGTVKMVVQ
jgi:hypothetical protein